MFISYRQNAGKSHNMKIGNRLFENVAKFKYLWKTVSDQYLMHEEIRSDSIPVMVATIQFRDFVSSSAA
jgi:hypothetical protein